MTEPTLKNRPKKTDFAMEYEWNRIQLKPFFTWFEGFEKKLREPFDERKIRLWLANTEGLPLILRVSAILELYQKELLGE